jgi:hypothetical protein
MSHDAGDVALHLDSYLDRVLAVTGMLYVVTPDEVFMAGSDLHWKHGQRIRLRDERVKDIAQTIGRFVPVCGGGTACWILDATVRGRISRSEEPESVAFLSEIEEVELRDDWLTARMRLRDAP